MTTDLEAWKEIAKDAMKALAGGFVVALYRRRPRPRPLSIASAYEPERFSLTREEWSDLMDKVNHMATTIALHGKDLERVKEERVLSEKQRNEFTTTLSKLSEGIQELQLQLARMGAPPA